MVVYDAKGHSIKQHKYDDINALSRFYFIYVIVIPRYEYDIVVITRVRGEAEYEC